MGDVPISYVEGVGGTRVSEDEIVAVGKHDVRCSPFPCCPLLTITGPLIQTRTVNTMYTDDSIMKHCNKRILVHIP